MSKFYEKHLLSTASAANKEEEIKIKAYNLAVINAVKTANKYEVELSREDVEDAGAQAGCLAVERLDPNRGSTSYAWQCGFSQVIKASEKAARKRLLVRSYDELSGWDGSDEYETRELPFASDDWADKTFREEEEAEELEHRRRAIREAFALLPERDQVMYRMLAEGKSYEDVAEVLDCTANSLYKRRLDGRERFQKNLRKVSTSFAA